MIVPRDTTLHKKALREPLISETPIPQMQNSPSTAWKDSTQKMTKRGIKADNSRLALGSAS